MTRIDPNNLTEAAEALKRAAEAARLSMSYPYGRVLPCETQQKAAKAEIDCALALIEKAQR